MATFRKRLRRGLWVLLGLLLILVAVALVRTALFESRQIEVDPIAERPIRPEAIENLAASVRIPTISYDDTARIDYAQFDSLHAFIERTYPLVHKQLTREFVNEYSVLYTWKGSDASQKPVIFLAHLDVVPSGDSTDWEQPAFSGAMAEGFLWGRGTLDDKVSAIGWLEATEQLLSEGFRPKPTVFLAFGHDEEIGGTQGAAQLVKLLESRGVEAELVLDEGMTITEGLVPGIEKPVALVGLAEKGYLTLQLTVEMDGGHASMPANETSITVLADAIEKLQANPFPTESSPALEAFLDYAGPEMAFGLKAAMANRWLTQRLVFSKFAAAPGSNALLRTTMAPTVLRAGDKANAIPTRASLTINLRILPGSTVDEAIAYVEKTIADPRVQIQQVGSVSEPSGISSHESWAFGVVHRTIAEVYPGHVVAPTLMIAGTDSKHYEGISQDVYRFLPIRLCAEDLSRIHGPNERIAPADFERLIRFYIRLVENLSESPR